MESNETRDSSRPVRAALVALVLIGLLALVAVGSRASHPLGHVRVHQRFVPQRVSNDLFTLFAITLGIGAVLFIVGLYSIRDTWREREVHWIRSFFSSLAVLLFALLFFAAVHAHFQHHRTRPPARNRGATGQSNSHLPKIVNPKTGAHFDWEFAAALAGLAVLAAAYLVIRQRREEPEPEPTFELEHELSEVVRETIDDLRREADPRRAVIAAYARMEGVLGRHGYGRRPAEAPYEYLQRVLVELHVAPGAVRELTDLFELAKFSPHRIGEDMRDRALTAFVSVRDDLKAAA